MNCLSMAGTLIFYSNLEFMIDCCTLICFFQKQSHEHEINVQSDWIMVQSLIHICMRTSNQPLILQEICFPILLCQRFANFLFYRIYLITYVFYLYFSGKNTKEWLMEIADMIIDNLTPSWQKLLATFTMNYFTQNQAFSNSYFKCIVISTILKARIYIHVSTSLFYEKKYIPFVNEYGVLNASYLNFYFVLHMVSALHDATILTVGIHTYHLV